MMHWHVSLLAAWNHGWRHLCNTGLSNLNDLANWTAHCCGPLEQCDLVFESHLWHGLFPTLRWSDPASINPIDCRNKSLQNLCRRASKDSNWAEGRRRKMKTESLIAIARPSNHARSQTVRALESRVQILLGVRMFVHGILCCPVMLDALRLSDCLLEKSHISSS
jgi:hypothetical protein